MAITILSKPNTPNVTGTSLVYSISSSQVPQYQFRYIADLYDSGSTDRLARFSYPFNSYGTCNISLARPLDDYLDTDYNWKYSRSDYTGGVTSIVTSAKIFDIKFGEQYGTSYSSSVTSYPALTTASIKLFKGSVYASETTNGYNWDSGSVILSDAPATQSFSNTDYLTSTIYNSNASVSYYRTGSLTAKLDYISTGDFTAIPISPLNVANYLESDVITLDVTGSSIRYEVDNDCRNEKQRLAFTNKYGFWDYYSNHTALRKSTNIDRKTYEQPSTRLNERVTNYNSANRGTSQYYTEYTDVFEFTTDSVTAETSQWLREMFDSTDVFIQSGSNFIPVNILNNSETIINNTARNKNYQYTIKYQYSNIREPR